MTYVEEMELKIWDARDRSGCAEIINQIMADTKRTCIYVVNFELAHHPRLSNCCVAGIDQAEVKAEREV